MKYTVKDVAKISGLTPYTIRYYCKIGLLGELKRDENNVKIFDDNDIKTIMHIYKCQHKNAEKLRIKM